MKRVYGGVRAGVEFSDIGNVGEGRRRGKGGEKTIAPHAKTTYDK